MRKLFTLSILILCPLLLFCGCIESSYDDSNALFAAFEEQKTLFLTVATEAREYGESTYISTYEFFRPEDVQEDASGLYVHDLKTGKTRSLESEAIQTLFASGAVDSLAVNVQDDILVCEFNMGGGRQYFNGVYYVEPDRPIFLNNVSIPLQADGNGFSYSVENMNYYTEKWDEHFYYYVAKTL